MNQHIEKRGRYFEKRSLPRRTRETRREEGDADEGAERSRSPRAASLRPDRGSFMDRESHLGSSGEGQHWIMQDGHTWSGQDGHSGRSMEKRRKESQVYGVFFESDPSERVYPVRPIGSQLHSPSDLVCGWRLGSWTRMDWLDSIRLLGEISSPLLVRPLETMSILISQPIHLKSLPPLRISLSKGAMRQSYRGTRIMQGGRS